VRLNARAHGNETGRNDTLIGAANAALNAHRTFGEFARVGCLAAGVVGCNACWCEFRLIATAQNLLAAKRRTIDEICT